jgi:YHS domain-containing protein
LEEEAAMKKLSFSMMLAGLFGVLIFGYGAVAQAGDDRLALKGYDPVAYFTEKRPTVGNPQYQYKWDGAVYRFASAKHLDSFKADPDRYLPQFNSLCAASLAKGIKYEGNPEYWLVVDGRLYLFGAPVGPSLKADAVAITRKADENWPKVSRPQDAPRL